jgi:hypothetical protein
MRSLFTAIVALLAVLVSSAGAMAQTPQSAPGPGGANTLYNRLNIGPGGPAPVHDLSGSWTGPLDSTMQGVPPMTPLGKERMATNKPERVFHIAGTNDPFSTCDPLGFPRSDYNEVRGMAFATMNDRIIIMNQYQRAWREVWMDGRTLPKNAGASEKGAPDPRYYGYSVGHWEGDNVLVVDTTGLDDRTWLNSAGLPHSIDAHVQERFTRIDHNDLQLVVTIDDPKLYTKPWVFTTDNFKWIPDQQLEEQLCLPSEMLEYMKIIGQGGAGK